MIMIFMATVGISINTYCVLPVGSQSTFRLTSQYVLELGQ
jgi:hypothetical protein